MHKSHLTEADREHLLFLELVAARPTEREQRRRQGLTSTLDGYATNLADFRKDCAVDCGDRQATERLH